jgi:hypothetical protein
MHQVSRHPLRKHSIHAALCLPLALQETLHPISTLPTAADDAIDAYIARVGHIVLLGHITNGSCVRGGLHMVCVLVLLLSLLFLH